MFVSLLDDCFRFGIDLSHSFAVLLALCSDRVGSETEESGGIVSVGVMDSDSRPAEVLFRRDWVVLPPARSRLTESSGIERVRGGERVKGVESVKGEGIERITGGLTRQGRGAESARDHPSAEGIFESVHASRKAVHRLLLLPIALVVAAVHPARQTRPLERAVVSCVFTAEPQHTVAQRTRAVQRAGAGHTAVQGGHHAGAVLSLLCGGGGTARCRGVSDGVAPGAGHREWELIGAVIRRPHRRCGGSSLHASGVHSTASAVAGRRR